MWRLSSVIKKSGPALLALAVSSQTCWAAAGWKVGDTLPDLGGYGLEGQLPEKLKGQVVLLDFWASWCAPCKQSFPVMEALQKQYGGRGFVILAINEDDKSAAMTKFVKQTGVSFAVVRDANQKLVAAADAATMPTSFLIDRAGKIRYVHHGYHGESTRKEYAQEIETLLKESAP